MSRILFILAAVFSVLACTEHISPTVDNVIDEGSSDEIIFSVDEALSTRADLLSLSSFNVLCITGTMGGVSEKKEFTAEFVKDGSYYKAGKYWPQSNPSYSFYASNASITSIASGAYLSVDGTTDVVAAYCKYDSSASNYKQIIPLTFEHIYAKLGYCKVTAPQGYSVSNLTVSFVPYIKGSYYIYKKSWTKWNSTDIILATTLNSTAVNGSYIIPDTYKVSLSYTLTKDSYTEAFTKSLNLTFVAGKINNIVLNLPSGNIGDVIGTVTVDSWYDGGDIVGEI